MRGCNLGAIPQEVYGISGISFLDLADNAIAELPRDIGKLQQLRHLCLDNNQLRTLPVELTDIRCARKRALNTAERARLQLSSTSRCSTTQI